MERALEQLQAEQQVPRQTHSQIGRGKRHPLVYACLLRHKLIEDRGDHYPLTDAGVAALRTGKFRFIEGAGDEDVAADPGEAGAGG